MRDDKSGEGNVPIIEQPLEEALSIIDSLGSALREIEHPTGPRGTVLSSDGRLAELDHVSGILENKESK